jgi:WD40 repeat protein
LTELRLWDLETGERVKDVLGREEFGRGPAALSRDGRRMAFGDFGVLRILDVRAGRLERTITLPGCRVDQPAFSPDGTLVAMAIDNAIGIFEVSTGRRLHHDERTTAGYLGPASWSPAGDRIVTGHSDGQIRVWDATTGKLVWNQLMAPVIGDHGNGGVASVDFTRDARQVVAAGRQHDPFGDRGGIIAAFNAASGLLEQKADHSAIRRAALAPDGRMMVVSHSPGNASDAQLVGVEMGSGKTRWSKPTEATERRTLQIAGMGFESGTSFLQVAMNDGNVLRLNAFTGREQHRFLADGQSAEEQKNGPGVNRNMKNGALLFYVAAFSDDGRTMVSYGSEWICVWDVAVGKLRRRIRYPHPGGCFLTLSSDGKTMATVDLLHAGEFSEDKIRLYDTETGDLVLTLDPGDDRANVLAFSPDDTKLFTGFHRGTAIVWDVRRGHGAARAKK